MKRTFWLGCIVGAWLSITATARAEATPSVLVLTAKEKPGSQAAEIAEAVRDALQSMSEVRLLPPPALDLEAVQLALDCSDESAQCLGEIAKRMDAEVLILPRLEQSKDSLELRITRFEHGSDPAVAMRKQAGTRLDATLRDAVPSMLRELLRIDEASEDDATAAEPAEAAPSTQGPAEDGDATSGFALPLGPVLLAGGGLVLVATGVVVGAIASSTEDEYAGRTIDTPEKAEAANVLRANGRDQARAANLLLVAGAGALIGAGVWYVLVGPSERAPTQASVRPVLGPNDVGLVLSGAWELPR